MDMTVNQIRMRLGNLVELVFTDSFRETYERLVPQMESNAEYFLEQYMLNSDVYIVETAKMLTAPRNMDIFNESIYPPVIFCVGLRYHLLTTELKQKDQNEIMVVPTDDAEFYTYMLITYCKSEA